MRGEWRKNRERGGGAREAARRIKLPASLTLKILPPPKNVVSETRMMLFAIVTNLGPRMAHTVDTLPIV